MGANRLGRCGGATKVAAMAAAILGAAVGALRAETWRTTDGFSAEGKLTGVYGPLAVIAAKDGTRRMLLEKMDDASLGQVADFLAAPGASAGAWAQAASPVAKALRNRLQVLQGGKLANFEPGARREPEVYLAYFGALWCGPCVRFSPQLAAAYTRLKAKHGERFELVFVSSDNGSGEQLEYVRKAAMPWPVIKFSALGSVRPIEQWAARGIPSLVAIAPSGDVLFHSYVGDEYVGPQRVLQQFEELMALEENSGPVKRSRHRLEVLRHVRTAGAGAAGAKPYAVGLDLGRYQTLEQKELLATLRINARGQVEEATFEPKLPVVVEHQLVNDAEQWLFLPRVENGQTVPVTVKLPLTLAR
jgi:thiol-disulfide isomerase/thioredoxin